MPKSLEVDLRNKYDFPSDILDTLVGGKSYIDAPVSFLFESPDDATQFIHNYGYNLDNPIEHAELIGNFHEALHFVRKNFLHPKNLDGLKLEIPRPILELSDVRELFMMVNPRRLGSSGSGDPRELAQWACSLLKIMHTISHVDKDLRTPYFGDIQQQILDRFYRFIHRDEDGQLFLGEKSEDPYRVNLVAFETKPKKSRESIILKLLHKSENIAEDIFDRVGLRFTTHSCLDALRLVRYLKDKMIIVPANIKPSRSKNTLIQVDQLRKNLDTFFQNSENQFFGEAALTELVEPFIQSPHPNFENPHSSKFYRSIQFTCRQLIKLRNSLYDDIRELKSLVKVQPTHETVTRLTDKIDLKHVQREIRFFYPFEIQIMDKKSAEENERGASAHSQYKRTQVLSAMKRVMGGLMNDIR